jgi:hypothetical protein
MKGVQGIFIMLSRKVSGMSDSSIYRPVCHLRLQCFTQFIGCALRTAPLCEVKGLFGSCQFSGDKRKRILKTRKRIERRRAGRNWRKMKENDRDRNECRKTLGEPQLWTPVWNGSKFYWHDYLWNQALNLICWHAAVKFPKTKLRWVGTWGYFVHSEFLIFPSIDRVVDAEKEVKCWKKR